MTTRQPVLIAGLALLLGGWSAARADEGRTPIFGQTIITRPGSYFLARGLTVDGTEAITIGADNVTIDLNGQTIRGSTFTPSLIQIYGGTTSVRIRNGRLAGGVSSIGYDSTLAPPIRLYLQNVDFVDMLGTAVNIESASHVEVVGCRFHGSGGMGGGAQFQGTALSGRFTDNLLTDLAFGGLKVFGTRQFLVRGNVFSNVGAEGIFLGSGQAALIEGNTLAAIAGTDTTWGMRLEIDGALVQNNVISGYTIGLHLSSRGSRVAHNVVRNAVSTGSSGTGIALFSSSRDTLIFRNQIEGNAGCGLELGSGTTGNVYRSNMLRGNALGLCDNGAGNIDGGGNIQ